MALGVRLLWLLTAAHSDKLSFSWKVIKSKYYSWTYCLLSEYMGKKKNPQTKLSKIRILEVFNLAGKKSPTSLTDLVGFFHWTVCARPENLQLMSLDDSRPFNLLSAVGQFPCFKVLNQSKAVGHSCSFEFCISKQKRQKRYFILQTYMVLTCKTPSVLLMHFEIM